MQLLENEQNLKTKNEIDQAYLKSLRYTVKSTINKKTPYTIIYNIINLLNLDGHVTQKATHNVEISTRIVQRI